MGRKVKFSQEIKIKACENYKNGKGSFVSISSEVGCNSSVFKRWYYTYCEHGATAFECTKANKSYSADFKLTVVKEYFKGAGSPDSLAAKYNISNSMVINWIKLYNEGIELKDYFPKGDVYTMKSRKTTFEERLEIVRWTISNLYSYSLAADKFAVPYAIVYKWTKDYLREGEDALKYKKRGPKNKNDIDTSTLSEIELLKLELEKERLKRERVELELEVLKKKEEFQKKIRYRR